MKMNVGNHHHNRSTAFFREHPGEPLPEENFWTVWCKGGLTEADIPTIQLGAIPFGPTSAHLHHPPPCRNVGKKETVPKENLCG